MLQMAEREHFGGTVPQPQEPKPRGGRPPLPPDERRSEVIAMRVTPQEADAAYQYAIRHGVPLDTVLRRILARLLRAE